MYVYGKEIANNIKEKLKRDIEKFKEVTNTHPALAIIQIGDNASSDIYIRNKMKACEKVGIRCFLYKYNITDMNERKLIHLIKDLNGTSCIHGIIVQLPLPAGYDATKVLETIDPSKDVDGFHPVNAGKLYLNIKETLDPLYPATAQGVMELIHSVYHDIKGKNAVVIGRSSIVGKPVAMMLLKESCTVTICHSFTYDLEKITKNANIVVVAIGHAKFIKKEHIKEGALVIDVGTNYTSEGLVGDADLDPEWCNVTPVPGGVGPLTVAMLCKNTYLAAKNQYTKWINS